MMTNIWPQKGTMVQNRPRHLAAETFVPSGNPSCRDAPHALDLVWPQLEDLVFLHSRHGVRFDLKHAQPPAAGWRAEDSSPN